MGGDKLCVAPIQGSTIVPYHACVIAHTLTPLQKKSGSIYIVHYRSFVHICSYVPGKVCMVNGIEPGCLVHAWNQKTEQAEHQIRPWSSTLRCRHFRLWNKRDIHLSRLGLLFGLVFESQERNGGSQQLGVTRPSTFQNRWG